MSRKLRRWNVGRKNNHKARGFSKKYKNESFQPWAVGREQEHLTSCRFGHWFGGGGWDGLGLRGREKSKCTRFANVESEYAHKTKKKRR